MSSPLDQLFNRPTFEQAVLSHYTADELRALAAKARRAQPPERYSMSALRQSAYCLLSAKLDVEAGKVAGVEATWGRAFHEVAAACGFAAQMTDRPGLDPDEAARMAQVVLGRIPDPLDPHGDKLVRGWVKQWAQTATFPTHADEWLVEDLWVHALDGHPISAKLDLVSRTQGMVEIEDYKTGQATPRDITWLPQPRIYAWQALQHWPDTELVIVTERYVRSGVPRTAVYDAEYIESDIEPWLLTMVQRLAGAYERGVFEALPGSWCARCALPDRCPVPEESRPASLREPDALRRLVATIPPLEARVKRAKDAARAVMKELGAPAVVIGDRELGFHAKTKQVTDYGAVSGVLQAAGYEDGIEEFKTARTAQEFGWAKVTEEDDDDEG